MIHANSESSCRRWLSCMLSDVHCCNVSSPFFPSPSLPSSLRPSLAVCSKDVSLPQDMQRAMAAEAEATREANAKVNTDTSCGRKKQLLFMYCD